MSYYRYYGDMDLVVYRTSDKMVGCQYLVIHGKKLRWVNAPELSESSVSRVYNKIDDGDIMLELL